VQGYLLKRCKTHGDTKPFKRRFFVLQGGTLYYFRSHSLGGRAKLFKHLSADTRVQQHPFTSDGRYPNALHIILPTIHGDSSSMSGVLAAETPAIQLQWFEKLSAAVGQPLRRMEHDQDHAATSGVAFRLRLSVSGALASSLIGRSVGLRLRELTRMHSLAHSLTCLPKSSSLFLS
jgi:hypothetical protein